MSKPEVLREPSRSALLALLIALTACSGDPSKSTGPTDSPGSTSGDPAVDLAVETTTGGARMWIRTPSTEQLDAPVEGTLRWDASAQCFLLERDGRLAGVVWPTGTTADAASATVVTNNGEQIAVGQYVMGTGGYLDVAAKLDIPAGCAPTAGEVAVFNADSALTIRS